MSLWQKIKLNSLIGTQPVLNLWPSHILYSRKIRGCSVSQTHTALCFCAFVHSVHFVWTAHLPCLTYEIASIILALLAAAPLEGIPQFPLVVGKHLLHLSPCRAFSMVSHLYSCCPYPEAIYLRASFVQCLSA